MNYKTIWNLSRQELKKVTNAAQRLEAARAYVRDFKGREASTERINLSDTINDAANIFSISNADYCRIYDALKKDARNH